jgi:hypothetical protein
MMLGKSDVEDGGKGGEGREVVEVTVVDDEQR